MIINYLIASYSCCFLLLLSIVVISAYGIKYETNNQLNI